MKIHNPSLQNNTHQRALTYAPSAEVPRNKCLECGESFPSRIHLFKHLRAGHDIDNEGDASDDTSSSDAESSTDESPELPHTRCLECDEQFPSRNSLFKHLRAAHNIDN